MLEKVVTELGDSEFKLFESWLGRVTSWADHDALVHYLIAPMIVAKPVRISRVFRWAKSRNRWHRRAGCVALIQGTRQKMFFREIMRLSDRLLYDQDDMVQKGLGWLLRETAKAAPKRTIPYLMKIRDRAPRLVLRTARNIAGQSASQSPRLETHSAILNPASGRARTLGIRRHRGAARRVPHRLKPVRDDIIRGY
jgi:3-methyladenine DNA glycosylase AlkD